MSSDMLLLSVCLALAFGGVPLVTLIPAHIATARAARRIAEIEAIAASRTGAAEQHPNGIKRLGVLELQAIAVAAAEELSRQREARLRELGPRRNDPCDQPRAPSPPLAKAG